MCLTFEAASYTPFSAVFRTYLTIEAFQHFEYACDTEVERVIGVAAVHDPRSGQEWHINADDAIRGESAPAAVVAIRGESAPAAVVAIRRQGGGNSFPDE